MGVMQMKTILVVEDNQEIAELFRTLLTIFGFTAVVAGSLSAAMIVFARMQVDALIVDYNLPDGKGPELLARLGDRAPSVCLLVTGDPVKAPGFDRCFMKPVECDKLIETLRDLFARKCKLAAA